MSPSCRPADCLRQALKFNSNHISELRSRQEGDESLNSRWSYDIDDSNALWGTDSESCRRGTFSIKSKHMWQNHLREVVSDVLNSGLLKH